MRKSSAILCFSVCFCYVWITIFIFCIINKMKNHN
nr:MAG TPA: hypothetical protein [Caudoviricetes sp.]DAW34789.1 MAG TPA: hypothetical protein [Caudoviricetes sp.]